MIKQIAVGVDIGGSHISCAAVNIYTRELIPGSVQKEKLNNHAQADSIFESWGKAIQKTIDFAGGQEKILGIGFAMPGPFDYKNGTALMDKSVAKYENLYGLNVGDELKRLLMLPDTLPFRYLNDALAFAVGECWIGTASGFRNVVAVTLGTGFGSAFLMDGIPVIEGERVPGKGYVYNIPYENGIADDYFSTRWFIAEFKKRTGIQCDGVREIVDNKSEAVKVKQLFHEFGNNIGNFLVPLLSNFNAGCLVIGGNISGAYSLFGSSMENALKKRNIIIPVLVSEYMESAAVAGSARLLDEKFRGKIEPVISKI